MVDWVLTLIAAALEAGVSPTLVNFWCAEGAVAFARFVVKAEMEGGGCAIKESASEKSSRTSPGVLCFGRVGLEQCCLMHARADPAERCPLGRCRQGRSCQRRRGCRRGGSCRQKPRALCLLRCTPLCVVGGAFGLHGEGEARGRGGSVVERKDRLHLAFGARKGPSLAPNARRRGLANVQGGSTARSEGKLQAPAGTCKPGYGMSRCGKTGHRTCTCHTCDPNIHRSTCTCDTPYLPCARINPSLMLNG
jgi:hypothetical protein